MKSADTKRTRTDHLDDEIADFLHENDNACRGVVVVRVGPHETHGVHEGSEIGLALVERHLLQLIQADANRNQEQIDVSCLSQTCRAAKNILLRRENAQATHTQRKRHHHYYHCHRRHQ